MKSISIAELEEVLQNPNSKIVDIRDNYIYQLGTIPTAINIPGNFLMAMPHEYLDHQTHYYLLCDYGVTSSKVGKYLSSLGYDVSNISGGYHSYHDNKNIPR